MRETNTTPVGPINMWLFAAPSVSHFCQYFPYPQQLVVKDFFCHIEQVEKSRIGNRIKHTGSRLPSRHDVPEAQYCQLL